MLYTNGCYKKKKKIWYCQTVIQLMGYLNRENVFNLFLNNRIKNINFTYISSMDNVWIINRSPKIMLLAMLSEQ